jgi:hypothetical protein
MEPPFDRHEPVRPMNGSKKHQQQNDLKGDGKCAFRR